MELWNAEERVSQSFLADHRRGLCTFPEADSGTSQTLAERNIDTNRDWSSGLLQKCLKIGVSFTMGV